MAKLKRKLERISVIVPQNPFTRGRHEDKNHCLCALHVDQIMQWWPGTPHVPHRDSDKVRAIQRSLDWKRVVHIAAYLLQQEIRDAPDLLDKHFKNIYEPLMLEPGRVWPPRVNKVIGFEYSEFPSFSNILVHINGAKLETGNSEGSGLLIFDSNNKNLKFTVIDGQHRVNGAYLALKILLERDQNEEWSIPAEIFLDLDKPGDPPKLQAQIFIDVNFYQKKVDRSLVADLFPTTRAGRDPINTRERAQDMGRKLMLETGPLVGMIQIPGITYGVKNVVTLATLVGAIEDNVLMLDRAGITDINSQTDFLAQVLTSWLDASGRRAEVETPSDRVVDSQNVVYQGRILVSVLSLSTAALTNLSRQGIPFISKKAEKSLKGYFKNVIVRAGFMKKGSFLGRDEFKKKGFLGSGGIARFRNRLWAATKRDIAPLKDHQIEETAELARAEAAMSLERIHENG